MRAASAAAWLGSLKPRQRVHFYSVDPGAHAIGVELVPLLKREKIFGSWFAEGWSGSRVEQAVAPVEIARAIKPNEMLLVGSQTNFAKTQAVFATVREIDADSAFIFDHWKNYREHFGSSPLPSRVIVPDELGKRLMLDVHGDAAARKIQVLPHLALEASADKILSHSERVPGTIALLLDPTEPEHGLGYDWRSTLNAAIGTFRDRNWKQLLVKPHPRQSVEELKTQLDLFAAAGVACELYSGDAEMLMAIADEVWGMTTVALVAALLAGKPIRSFQVGRNAAGAAASNPHIEPFVII